MKENLENNYDKYQTLVLCFRTQNFSIIQSLILAG